MILIPLILGQLFSFPLHGSFSGWSLCQAVVFGALYQVYLLYTNDHSDEAVDRINTRFWLSGGSRVLPQGKLNGRDLLIGARSALALLIAWTLILALVLDRPAMVPGTLLAVGLCWAYNRPPLQWSYRGQGEILQGLGCGVLLPLIGFYLQSGTPHGFPWSTLLPLFLIFYAGNLITALPDTAPDRQGDKRTFSVRHGESAARNTAVILLMIAYVSISLLPSSPGLVAGLWIVGPSSMILLGVIFSGLMQRADSADFPACQAFVTWVSISQAWALCAWIVAMLMRVNA